MIESIRVLFVDPAAGDYAPLARLEGINYTHQVCAPALALRVISFFRPDVIVSLKEIPEELNHASFEIRRRWIHVDAIESTLGSNIEACYTNNLWGDHPAQHAHPLVSVYTPVYDTGDLIYETYRSLADQTYPNWEWIVIDDGSNDGTYDDVLLLAAGDSRIRPISIPHNGKIGALKGLATRMAYGSLLVELDHDDMLTDNALWEIKTAFDDPCIGMVYSNFAEFYEDGTNHEYRDEFWTGRYRDTVYRGRLYREARAPSMYGRWGPSIQERHAWYLTVNCNHVRAFRKSELERLGGYNRELPVSDDFDLMTRFFLYSYSYHIDHLLYLYRFRENNANTTFIRNKSIQDHLALCRRHYALEFERLDSVLPSLPSKDLENTNPKFADSLCQN